MSDSSPVASMMKLAPSWVERCSGSTMVVVMVWLGPGSTEVT